MATRPSLRKTTRRQKKSYREPDSEPDSDVGTPTPRRLQPFRASRYLRDAYDDDDDTCSESSSAEGEEALPAPQVQVTVPVRRKNRSIGQAKDTAFHSFKRRKITHPNSAKDVPPLKDISIPGITTPISLMSSRIPPWQNLEYQILLKIMQYAAYPLYTGASKDSGSVRWLLDTSELCSSFHDACIGALVQNPPLFPAHRAHWLVDLLKASARDYDFAPIRSYDQLNTAPSKPLGSTSLSLDYRNKIKSLDIEVKQILVKKAGIELADLLQGTPLLRDLRLYHNHDSLADKHIWATPSNSRSQDRWSYTSLFEALERTSIELRSFEWNGRFLKDDSTLSLFSTFQIQSRCLRKLTSLSLRNFILPHAEKLADHVTGTDVTDINRAENLECKQLAAWRSMVLVALNSLPELKKLSLHSCNIFDDTVISSLPSGLTHLNICSTPFIKSEGLQQYLHNSGATLTNLLFRGNQALSLGFMAGLAITTPALRELEIDLTYHDPTSFRDTEPLFDDLLPDGPPTWPSTLEAISIGPLRNLSTEDAEAFFQSLVNASSSLPYLRSLSLRTLLKKASWRDRAQLRGKWDAQLYETFHVKYNAAVSPPLTPPEDKKHRGRESRRIKSSDQVQASSAQLHGEGRCHTVIFELSDQRPAQDQFREADFLDSEPEGDEEWNGKDDAVEAPRYSSRRYAW